MIPQETIVALATPSGAGAIAIIRLSGKDAITIAADVFQSVSGKDITKQKTHTIHLGHIVDNGKVYDQVLLSIFKGPNSYTGENVIEISCHGSTFIQQQIIQLLLRRGAKMAQAGEFTLRAFLNGKLDLSQAEAVADLIASDNEASHQIAMQQMRGGFSNEIAKLREELLNFASLIELELDFAEEDVEFADRTQFHDLLERIEFVLKRLIDSFAVGNVIKNGIPVAIVGEPNVGKSTLLNALLNEERAIVSDIAGTTRDTIEEVLHIKGNAFRLIDTAGLRETEDAIEAIGVVKAKEKVAQADVLVYLIDVATTDLKDDLAMLQELAREDLKIIICLTKIDEVEQAEQKAKAIAKILQSEIPSHELLKISAKENIHLQDLKDELSTYVEHLKSESNVVITNQRHYESLQKSIDAVYKVKEAITHQISTELLAYELRNALEHLGEISGEFTNDEVLGNIFSKFCIGK